MRGAFFIWSWLSQKCCFGNEILFARFYTMKVHICTPVLWAGSTESVAVWLCKGAWWLVLGSAGG